jgi:hypothetical protein
MKTKFELIQTHDEYHDYVMYQYQIPDRLHTSVDVQLSLDVINKTANIGLFQHDDNGDTKDLIQTSLPWADALARLAAYGVNVQEYL